MFGLLSFKVFSGIHSYFILFTRISLWSSHLCLYLQFCLWLEGKFYLYYYLHKDNLSIIITIITSILWQFHVEVHWITEAPALLRGF